MVSVPTIITMVLLVVTPIPAKAEEDDFWDEFLTGFFISEVVDAVTEASASPPKIVEQAEGDPPPPGIIGGLMLIGMIALTSYLIMSGQMPWGWCAGILFSCLLKGTRGRRH